MIIKMIGTESFGVRGLACSVVLKNRKIFIDPGIALGLYRHGLPPHPFQIAVGRDIRDAILQELESATDVVFSHFDGDHCPLEEANPYQLGADRAAPALARCRIWAKGPQGASPKQQARRNALARITGRDFTDADGIAEGPLSFSSPVPHGRRGQYQDTVLMTRIEEDGETFVHASDIQLTDAATVEKIVDWHPDTVLLSGPPLYRHFGPSLLSLGASSRELALELSGNVDRLIIDHHVLRSQEGIEWLEKLKQAARRRILCAADFMKREPLFLEAWRGELYQRFPPPPGWHVDYALGKTDPGDYAVDGEHWRRFPWHLLRAHTPPPTG